MPEFRRVQLDWTKLFAFEQVEAEHRAAMRATAVAGRMAEKIGGKEPKPLTCMGAKVGEKLGVKADGRLGTRLGAKIGDKAVKDDRAR
jgi:hypothetical protein